MERVPVSEVSNEGACTGKRLLDVPARRPPPPAATVRFRQCEALYDDESLHIPMHTFLQGSFALEGRAVSPSGFGKAKPLLSRHSKASEGARSSEKIKLYVPSRAVRSNADVRRWGQYSTLESPASVMHVRCDTLTTTTTPTSNSQLRRLANRHSHMINCLATSASEKEGFKIYLNIAPMDLHDFAAGADGGSEQYVTVHAQH